MRGSAVPSCCSIPFPMHRKEGPLLSANTALRGGSQWKRKGRIRERKPAGVEVVATASGHSWQVEGEKILRGDLCLLSLQQS